MNKLFEEFSLAVGGSHYPTINSDMQQKFGEAIVKHIVKKIDQEAEIAHAQHQAWTQSVLLSLSLDILDDFEMEIEE